MVSAAMAALASLCSLPRLKTVHRTVFLTPCSVPIYIIKREVVPKGTTSFLERVMGIEPTQPAWKAGILAVELHPHLNFAYNNTKKQNSQDFLLFFIKKFLTKN